MKDRLKEIVTAAVQGDFLAADAGIGGPWIRLISLEKPQANHLGKLRRFQNRVREELGIQLIAVAGGYGCINITFVGKGAPKNAERLLGKLARDIRFQQLARDVGFSILVLEDEHKNTYERTDLRRIPRSSDNADFAILTALPSTEFAILRERLKMVSPDETVLPRGKLTFYKYHFQGTDGALRTIVATYLPRIGNLAAVVTASKFVETFEPDLLIFVGIAGALGQNSGLKIGDVVVADQVFHVEARKKVSGGATEYAPVVYRADEFIRARVQQLLLQKEFMDSWRKDLIREEAKGVQAPNAIVGDIASGDTVLNSVDLVQEIRALNRKLMAIDMEAAGMLESLMHHSQDTRTMVVRGISDYGDGTKDDKWQQYASKTASSFTVNFIRALDQASTDSYSSLTHNEQLTSSLK